MVPHRLRHLLVLVSLLCVAHASWLGLDNLLHRRLNHPRQAVETGDVSNPPTSASSASKSSPEGSASKPPSSASDPPQTSQTPSSPSTETPTATSAPPAQSTDRPPQTSKTPSASSQTPNDGPATSSPASPTSAETQLESTSSTPRPSPASDGDGKSTSSPKPTPVVSTSIQYITMTNSDGATMVSTSTTRTTSTPGLNSGSSAQTSGMSTKDRNTIIGVVVGVGGAIALGALGLVAWRIWGRRKNSDENDGLMEYDMAATGMEKPEPGVSAGPGPRSPFQSTLENYHQPTQVNASSNF